MKTNIRLALALFILPTVHLVSNAQTVLDGPYIRGETLSRKVVPYAHLRQADVMWSKRIWRTIDLREKLNHPLYFPEEEIADRQSLFNVIKSALLIEGAVTAFDPGINLDDEFGTPFTRTQLQELFFSYDTIMVPSLDGDYMEPRVIMEEVVSSDVKKYWIKEDWFFDRQRSVMDVRIVGLAPLVEFRGEDGEVRGERPLFWLYFPECRYVFANVEVFNVFNDNERLSLNDVFEMRMFSSYIHKESNAYDRYIWQYKVDPLEALLESEKIKKKMFEFEHDLWSY